MKVSRKIELLMNPGFLPPKTLTPYYWPNKDRLLRTQKLIRQPPKYTFSNGTGSLNNTASTNSRKAENTHLSRTWAPAPPTISEPATQSNTYRDAFPTLIEASQQMQSDLSANNNETRLTRLETVSTITKKTKTGRVTKNTRTANSRATSKPTAAAEPITDSQRIRDSQQEETESETVEHNIAATTPATEKQPNNTTTEASKTDEYSVQAQITTSGDHTQSPTPVPTSKNNRPILHPSPPKHTPLRTALPTSLPTPAIEPSNLTQARVSPLRKRKRVEESEESESIHTGRSSGQADSQTDIGSSSTDSQ